MSHPLFEIVRITSPKVEIPTVEQWTALKASGIDLPTDYREFLSFFGTGVLADFFYVFNPFSRVRGMNWFEEIAVTTFVFNVLISHSPELYRHWRFFPQPGGLLPCGKTGNGDFLFWSTEGSALSWPICISDGSPSLDVSGDSLCDFLFKALTNSKYSKGLPDLMSAPKTFIKLDSVVL
jgi:hypothetical protein